MDRLSQGAEAAAKELFGRPLRVYLAQWITERSDEAFFQTEAQDAMRLVGQAASGVPDVLDALVRAELLQRFDSERRVYFQPRPSPLWDAFQAVYAGLKAAHGSLDPTMSLKR